MGFVAFSQVSFGDGALGDGLKDGNPADEFACSLSGADVVIDPLVQSGTSQINGAALRAAVDAVRQLQAILPGKGFKIAIVDSPDADVDSEISVEYQPASSVHVERYRLRGPTHTHLMSPDAWIQLVQTVAADGSSGALELLGFP